MNIVEIAETEVKKANATKVSEITLEIGKMAGVVIEALEFAMEEAVKDSVLQNSKLIIKEKAAKAKCDKCNHIYEIEEIYSPSPKCQSFYSDVIEGKELKVLSMSIA